MRQTGIGLLTLIAAVFAATAIGKTGSVEYPSDFRSWQHVKTGIIQPGHALEDRFGGIHHVYANAKAMNGLSAAGYEDGAVFVFDLLSYVDSNLTIAEGSRVRVDVMQFDRTLFASTGGWGFASFAGDSRTPVDQDVVSGCYNCHVPAKESNYVYSQYRP